MVIDTAWNNIKQATIDTWDNIKQSLSDTWNNIKSTVTEAISNVKQNLNDGWNSIKQTVSDTWQNIKEYISNSWNHIKQICSATVDKIKNTISDGWDTISSGVSTAWNNIKQIFKTIFWGIIGDVKEWISNLIDDILSPLRGLGSLISDALSTVVDAIVSPFRKAYKKVTEIVGWISDKISNITGRSIDVDVEYNEPENTGFSIPFSNIQPVYDIKPVQVPKVDVSTYDTRGQYYTPQTRKSSDFISAFNGAIKSVRGLQSTANQTAARLNNSNMQVSNTTQEQPTVTLNIENFNNNREIDIRDLVEEISFYIRQKSI